MPIPFSVPWAPGGDTSYRQPNSRIPELLLRQGQIEADRAARSGEIWGNAISKIGAGVGRTIAEGPERKLREAQAKRIEEESALKVAAGRRAADFEKSRAAAFQQPSRVAVLQSLESDPAGYDMAVKHYKAVDDSFNTMLGEYAAGVRAHRDAPEAAAAALADLREKGFGDPAIEKIRAQITDQGSTKQLVDSLLLKSPDARHQALAKPDYMNVTSGTTVFDKTTNKPVYTAPKEADPDKEATLTREQARDAEIARHNRALEDAARRKLDKPAAPKTPTGQERTALNYYQRAQAASDTVKETEDSVSKAGLAKQVGLQYLPNFAQSDEMQSYRQAQRAFTEARLRKESGATIKQDEYENDAKTYFAQPGDSKATIDQKRKSREVILDGLRISSGRSYEEYYGEPAPKTGLKKAGSFDSGDSYGYPEGTVITGPDGERVLRNGKWVKP